MSPEETAISIYIYFINSIGIPANLLLIYLVLTHSPPHLRVYSILLLNFGIVDFVGCCSGLFVQQRLIPLGGSIGFISLGPCTYLGATACYIGYSVILHCYSHSLWSILISFVFRYRILVSKAPSSCGLLATILLFYSICCLYSGGVSIRSRSTISGNLNIFGWKELFTNLHMTLPITPIYIIIIILGIRIVRYLRTHSMSAHTKAMHSQLLKALVAQAMLPALYFLTMLIFFFQQSGVLNSFLLEYVMMMIIVVSPLLTIYFITPYKHWITKKFAASTRTTPIQSGFSITEQSLARI